MAPINLGTGVLPTGDTDIGEGISGVVILAGQALYEDTATSGNPLKLTVTTNSTTGRFKGIALNSAPTAGQPVKYAKGGRITGTVTLVVGEWYHVCDTAGSLDTAAALATGDWGSLVGQADTANSLVIDPAHARVARA